MVLPNFLKRKSTYITLAILLLIGGWFVWSRSNSGKTTYETAAVEKRDLAQTVEVTGEIKPAARVDLSFQNGGKLAAVMVKVGDTVKTGQVLARLEGDDVVFGERSARASLALAKANLVVREAGETSQSIKVAETQVEQAQASYDKAIKDEESARLTTANAVQQAQLAFDTAQKNLDNSGAIADQNIQNAYDSARNTLLSALGPMQTALTDGDTISGVDNSAATADFTYVLGVLDSGSVDTAKNSYKTAKAAKATADTAVRALTSASTRDQIQAASDLVQTAITLLQTYLSDVQRVLAATLPGSRLSSTELTTKKSMIDLDRTGLSTQSTAVAAAAQSLKNTQLTRTQTVDALQDALKTAQVGLDTARTNADVQLKAAGTAVAIQKAALDAAQAALDLKRSGPRSVDLAPLRAAVDQAQVAYDKAQDDLKKIEIVSPVDGIISEVIPDIGEQITPSTPAIRLVGTSSFDIEAKVPETDIPKIQVGQPAEITLDAYGDDVKFKGTVTAKDPAETKVQDAVYYKIRVQIDPAGKEVKPSMTANVIVTTATAKDALVIPLRAVRTTDGKRSVRVLKGATPEARDITMGLKGDEGKIQVLSGLAQGELVITGEKAAQ